MTFPASGKHIVELSKLTLMEVLQSRIYLLLVTSIFFTPVFASIIASLFLVDIGKVYLDISIAGAHFVSIVFTLFIAASLLAKDIDQRICYIVLSPPVQRNEYILSRFIGLSIAFLILALITAIIIYLGSFLYVQTLPEEFQSDISWHLMPLVFFYIFFQYLSLIAIAVFFFSWATGTAEIMVFSSSIMLFAWVFPPVLEALQSGELAQEIPSTLEYFIQAIYQVLPHLNGSQIALAVAHNLPLRFFDLFSYMLEHTAYAALVLIAALKFFERRDL